MRKIAFLAVLSIIISGQAAAADFQVWVSDPLVNIMRDTAKPATTPDQVNITAARNEYESGQIVVTSTTSISALSASVGSISGPASPKPGVSLNFVGYVPIEHGTPYTPSENLVATAPGNFPDPLLESTSVSVASGENQPVWITVHVPLNTKPGTYTGTITVTGDGSSVSMPLSIEVTSAILPEKRTFYCTNWLTYEPMADYWNISMWSEAYWSKVAAFAQCMAEHRTNVIFSRLNRLIVGHDDGSGNLTFDFSRFDRWVNTFKSAGCLDIIEGGHLSGRKTWEGTDFYVWYPDILDPGGNNIRPHNVIVTSEQGRAFYAKYLPAIQSHLEEKGWIDMYIQHVGDEPLAQSAASYRAVADIVHQYAPKLKIIDASETTDLVGAIDIWCPQPQEYAADMAFFEQRKAAGDQVWCYTCLTPKGLYMNRFVDYPLIDVRLLHWQNYKYKIPGYLHWGFNAWHGDPFTKIEMNYGSTTTAFSPPGDTHIVYKGTNGPLSSIRLEAMRDGIEDYELLSLLAKSNPTRAQMICDSVITSFTSYTRDPVTFRALRRLLLDSLTENPLSVTQTKSMPIGSRIFLKSGIITADLRPPSGSLDLFYVEKDDRTAGIGVVASGSASYTAGQQADIFGKTSLLDGAELIVEPDVVSAYTGSAIKPLAMSNMASGGGASGDQPAVIDDASATPQPISACGLSSVGKLIRTWGTVTGSGQTSMGTVFWIDDGSNLSDGFLTSQGLSSKGLGVMLPPGMLIMPSGFVKVTGILRAVPNPSGMPVRLLVPKSGGDISD